MFIYQKKKQSIQLIFFFAQIGKVLLINEQQTTNNKNDLNSNILFLFDNETQLMNYNNYTLKRIYNLLDARTTLLELFQQDSD